MTDLDELLPKRKPASVWDKLTPEHQQWVHAKFQQGRSSADIATALTAAGYKVTRSTVNTWRP